MKKSEMIEVVAGKAGQTKADAERAMNAVFEMLKEELSKGNSVAIAGFGTFKVTERAARDGINPLTKQPLHIPAKKAVTFKAGTALKDAVN